MTGVAMQAALPVPLPLQVPAAPVAVVQRVPAAAGSGKQVATPPCGMHATALAHVTFWLHVKLTHGFSGTQVPLEQVPD